VRALLRRRHPKDKVRVVATGSRVQGNRLDHLNSRTRDVLRRILSQQGVLIVKGIANLDSMIGLRLDTLFIFAAKGARTSGRFEVPLKSLCGLWVPAGMPPDHRRGQFVSGPVD
jgi:uncharacterized protein with ATP-grasp and redox domains